MLQFTGYYRWNNTTPAWNNILTNVQDKTDAAVNSIGAAGDRLYIGLDRRFDGILFVLGAAGSYTSIIYEYWDGTAWASLPLTLAYTFSGNGGVVRFQIRDDWATRLLNTVEANDTGLAAGDTAAGIAKYWIRARVTAVSTTATINWSIPFPEYSYTSPTAVRRFAQFPTSFFTSTSIPSIQDVIDLIRRVESQIDKYSWKSWKPNYNPITDGESGELYDFSRYGIQLEKYPILHFIDLGIWNGSEFEVMQSGRQNDYFIDESNGFIGFTRLMHIPFTYSRSAIYTWGFGEFKRAVRVNYIWGRDIDFDPHAFLVNRIAAQLTAVDLIRSHDYSNLVTEGPDKISLVNKVEMWEREAYQTLDELRGLRIWVP